MATCKEVGVGEDELHGYIKTMFGVTSRKEITRSECVTLLGFLRGEVELEVAS
jgi:hypothetical protein